MSAKKTTKKPAKKKPARPARVAMTTWDHLGYIPPKVSEEERRWRRQAAILRADFASELGLRAIKWGAYNLTRMLNGTGDRPERVAEMRKILGELGMGRHARWPNTGGVFDHGSFWGRDGQPWAIVGHPYGIDDEQRALLASLARFGTLSVSVDDRPSLYGHGTHHVRIALVEARRPFRKPPSTPRTRAAARAARKAFSEAFGDGSIVLPREPGLDSPDLTPP